jgi:GNAT superfamily N-acetyltransferase
MHAFILDTVVAARARRCGIGAALIAAAASHARAAGCAWLHVDFEDHLAGFYFQACGFIPTSAGLISLVPRDPEEFAAPWRTFRDHGAAGWHHGAAGWQG